MSRPGYGDLKPAIIRLARLRPDWRAHVIAEAVGTNPEYVRVTLRNAKLARPGGKPPTRSKR